MADWKYEAAHPEGLSTDVSKLYDQTEEWFLDKLNGDHKNLHPALVKLSTMAVPLRDGDFIEGVKCYAYMVYYDHPGGGVPEDMARLPEATAQRWNVNGYDHLYEATDRLRNLDVKEQVSSQVSCAALKEPYKTPIFLLEAESS